MRIVLVGTDAPCAHAVIAQALERGHHVRALVAGDAVLATPHPELEAVHEPAPGPVRLAALAGDADALVAAGPCPPLTPEDLARAAAAAGVPRVLVVDPDARPPSPSPAGTEVHVLRPGRLVDGPRTGRYRLLPADDDGAAPISCGDVAHALLELLERRVAGAPEAGVAVVSW
jgi:putative NADH-flavin reductase